MSDIDFDELDRAVNGAINGAPTPAVTPEPANETPAPEAPAVSEVTPVFQTVERTTLTPTTTSPVTSTTAPVSRRSSGRFMDMVHPSSDMRSRNNDATPVRSAPVVAPLTTEAEAPEAPAWNEPLESPFLPDAKVEKRPLGGTFAPEELLEAPEPQELLEASMPDPIDFAAALAVTEQLETDAEPEVAEPEVSEPSQLAEILNPTVEEAPSQPEVTEPQPEIIQEAPQPIVEQPVGPTSITPQYQEQPSSNQESGAMYDTESYHQAVTQPIKKKSSWPVIIWIILLVALGAAAGWAVYTYVLPML